MRDLNGNERTEYCELYKDYLTIRNYIKTTINYLETL